MSRTSGNNNVGGMAGVNAGILITCYSAGDVSGTSNVGGLVGTNQYSSYNGTAENCFWDIEASGLANMCGIQGGDATGCDNTYGKTTIEMQTASNFLEAGWDFVGETANGTEDIWKISEGLDYPRLWWEDIER